MHTLFADWHRLVEIDLSMVDLKARWTGVESVVKQLDAPMVATVSRLACEMPDSTPVAATFAGLFKAHEPTFPMQNNARLLAVLAGAVAIHSMSTLGEMQTLVGYAVMAAVNVGWKPLLPELIVESSLYLATRADEIRKPVALVESKKAPAVWTTSLKEQLDSAADVPSLTKAIADMASSVQTTFTALTNDVANLRTWATTVVPPLEEEHDILWWLLSGYSELAEVPWADVPTHSAAILAAWELASLVRRLPAPRSSLPIVAQVSSFAQGDGNAKWRLAAAVEGLPVNRTYPAIDDSWIDLTPILATVHSRRSATTSRKALTSAELGQHALGEALLLRALQATK